MASMDKILVKDDSNPLVEFNLIPVTNSRPKWRAAVSGVPIEGQVTVELLQNTKLPDGNYRRVFKLSVPELETLGTAGTSAGYVAPQKVAFITPLTVTMIVNQRATVASCANAVKILLGLIGGAYATTGHGGDLSGASAADAVKSNTTGPITRFLVYGEDAT